MKYRYRLRIRFQTIRARIYPKSSYMKAVDDRQKLVSDAESGRLSPYYDGAVLSIERTPIDRWEASGEPVTLTVRKRLSPSLEADGESGVRSENGEELQPRRKDTT